MEMEPAKTRDGWKPIREVVEGLGYECVDVVLAKDGRSVFLRVFIDSAGGIQVKDCETVSRAVNAFLDQNEDLVKGKYYLEVSSPGLDRPLFSLQDYVRFRGKRVKIRTKEEVEGRKNFAGKLQEAGVDSISLETGPGTILRIPFDAIARGNLVYDEEQEKRRSL